MNDEYRFHVPRLPRRKRSWLKQYLRWLKTVWGR